jgi:hypothetical protein
MWTRRAVGDDVEVIVARRWEAGGHNYRGLPTMVLVPEILDAVSPALVLAAGGITDGALRPWAFIQPTDLIRGPGGPSRGSVEAVETHRTAGENAALGLGRGAL